MDFIYLKQKIKNKATQIANDPKMKKAFLSMKPEKTIWGILGVVFFFFLPELIAFIWGTDIVSYAQKELLLSSGFLYENYYDFLISVFEDGVSWFNLLFGLVLLVWLFY